MAKQRKPLSARIDEATHREQYYRDRLLFWKRRRKKLEEQIPSEVNEMMTIAMEAWGGDDPE